jgi:hypothetical protein
MSSKPSVKITNKSLGGNPLNSKGISDSINSVQTALNSIKTVLQSVINLVPSISPDTNPLTSIYKTIVSQIEKAINTILASGTQMILVTPFNQAKKRKLNIKFDLLNPVSELEQTVSALTTLSNNDRLQKEISELENQLSILRQEPNKNINQIDKLSSELEIKRKQIRPIQYVNDYITKVDETWPKLSASDAITEIIDSLSNNLDPYRPKWTDANTVAGIGFLISATTQVELLNNLQKLNNFFKITNLSKALEKAKEDINDKAKALQDSASRKEAKLKEDTLVKILGSINSNDKSETKKQSILSAFLEYEKSIIAPALYNNVQQSDFPMWVPFTIETIPYVRELRDFFLKLADIFSLPLEMADTILKTLLNSFLDKVESLVKTINEINNTINYLKTLQFGINAVTFIINPQTSDKGGGLTYMKEALTMIKNFPPALIENDQKTKKEIERLKDSEFSCVFFLATASTDFSILKKQFDALKKLFSLDIKGATLSSEDTKADSVFNSMDFIVDPEYIDLSSTISKPSIDFNLIFNPECSSFMYELECLSNTKFDKVKSSFETNLIKNVKTISFDGLIDLEKYRLKVVSKNKKQETLEKTYLFSTDFSLANLEITTTKENKEEIDSITSEDVSLIGISDIEIGVSEFEVTNGSDSTITVIVEDESGFKSLEALVLSGDTSTFPIIGEDGLYTIKAFTKYPHSIIKKILKLRTFSKVKEKSLKEETLYIKDSPTTILFGTDIGSAIGVKDSLGLSFNKTPYFKDVTPGIYELQVLKDGVWSDLKRLKVILSTDISEFCLTLD